MLESSITEEHSLTQEEAFKRIRNIFDDALKKHGDKIKNLKQEWMEKSYKGKASFTVNFKVKTISVSGDLIGDIEVNKGNVKLTVKYPNAALPLKPIVENMLRNGAKTRLNPKK